MRMTQTSPTAPPPTVSRRRQVFAWLLLPPLLAITLAISMVMWITHTTAGLKALASTLPLLLKVDIAFTNVRGNLAQGFSVDQIRIAHNQTHISIDRLGVAHGEFKLDPHAPRWLTVHVASLSAETIEIKTKNGSAPSEPLQMPSSLALPLGIDIYRFNVTQLAIHPNSPSSNEFIAQHTHGSIALGSKIEIRSLRSEIAGNLVTVHGHIDGHAPFGLELGGTLGSHITLPSENNAPELNAPIQIIWRATDNLAQITLYAGVTGGPSYSAKGSVQATLQPFTQAPIRYLKADLEGIDPAAWWPGAPRAQLQISTQLHASNSTLVEGTSFSLSGPLRVVNASPGPANRPALPIQRLTTTLSIDSHAITFSDLRAQVGQGNIQGWLRYLLRPTTPYETFGSAQLILHQIDLSNVHDGLQPLVISGPLAIQQQGGQTQFQATLGTPTGTWARARLELDATLNQNALAIHNAQLHLGDGYATFKGQLSRTDTLAFELNGTMHQLNLAILLSEQKNNDKESLTVLNGDISAQGALKPNIYGQAQLALSKSRVLGHPLQGQVQVALNPNDTLVLDARLDIHSAKLRAHGMLSGNRKDNMHSIELSFSAPQLSDLGLPIQGILEAQATLSGEWRAPAFNASATLKEASVDNQSIAAIHVHARYSGGPDGAMSLTADAREHTHPKGAALSLTSAQVSIEGLLSQMQIAASAQTRNNITYALRAQGGYQSASNEHPAQWLGTLQHLSADGALDTQLTAPAPILINRHQVALGPLFATVRGTQIIDLRIDWRQQELFETSGRFEHLVIQSNGIEDEPKLTLNGRWSIHATDTLNGSLHVERSSGDIHSGPLTQRVRMGLNALQLDALVQSNRMKLNAVAQGSQAGTLYAELSTMFDTPQDLASIDWRLAPDHPWTGVLSGNIPTLEWLNPFLSVNLRDNIRLAGKADFNVKLAGTPRTPRLSGVVNADALRVAWVEQGLRLDNGMLRAVLAPNTQGTTDLIVNQLIFSGQPRVMPQDRRIKSALSKLQTQQNEGVLIANGKIDLSTLEGLVQVRAERFAALQRPDRWLVVTGGANFEFSTQRMQLNGAVRADAGYIDITRRNAPSLSSDVMIIGAPGSSPVSPREPRIPFDFDVGIDLGPTFIVKGAGLDTRVEGTLLVKHAGHGAIRATGVLEARDGVYEGYGQKLSIERGRLGFQGAVENPSLDILALRQGLPVAVGVTITRTAANPWVRLYSDPPMADFETLSWLVLGRPADETRTDTTALAQAAIGLLGGSGEGVPTQLARRLGIDELSIRSAEAGGSASLLPRQSVAGSLRSDTTPVGGEIVYVGKRLSEKMTLSYETATTGVSNAVQLSYQLTRRLSLIARAGTESALDLVYTFAFD